VAKSNGVDMYNIDRNKNIFKKDQSRISKQIYQLGQRIKRN
jgi:hypothetical protein